MNTLRWSSLALGLFAALAAPAVDVRSEGWNIQIVDNTGSMGYQSRIAVTSDGTPYIIHVSGADYSLYLTWWVPATGNLGRWEKITVGKGYAFRTMEIVADPEDRLHMAWTNTQKDSLMYAVFDGPTKTWYRSPVGITRAQSSWVDLDIFDDGGAIRPTIAFARNGILNTATRNPVGGAWTFETVYSTGTADYVSVAVDSLGAIHLAFHEQGGNDLMYATNAHGSWTTEYVDITGNVGNYCSIVIEPGNVPYIVYYDQTNTDLKYARLNPASILTGIRSSGSD